MYNPRIGESITFQVRGQVLQSTVIRISAKTVSTENGWRIAPIFILDPALPPFEALNAVNADTNGTASPFKVGDTVRVKVDGGGRWGGKVGTVIKKNPKTVKINLSTPENPFGGTLTAPPSLLEAV